MIECISLYNMCKMWLKHFVAHVQYLHMCFDIYRYMQCCLFLELILIQENLPIQLISNFFNIYACSPWMR